MTKTIKILTLLAVMAITAGQVWADEPTYGIIHYTQGGTDGGRLSFSTTLDKTYNAQTDFNPYGVSSGNDWIYTYTVTGKTLTDGKVYVRALPSFGYTVTGMTITVEPSAPSSTAEAPRRGAPDVASTIPVTPVEGHSGVYTFPMPTDGTNVTVTASFPVSPPIDVDYLDATGAKKTAQAYVLDGAELYLGKSDQEIWYVCNSNIDYRSKVTLHGDAHLILADGKTMTISAGNQHAIYAENGVTIHGQSGASGKLIAESTGSNGIYSKGDVTIMSADVTFTNTNTTGFGVQANPGNITITDSKVTVNSGYHGIVATNVSNNLTKGNITINGSQVTAIGGTPANNYGINAAGGDITLGWKNTTDFIKASSYYGTVKTADGKPFIAYTPAATANDSEKQAVLIQGNTTFNANAIAAIAGKVLRPATADDVTVKYLDAKGDEQNTAEDNITDNNIVYVLQGGGATDLAGGWYVAKGEVSYTGQLRFTSDAHLILADGAEMTVGTATAPIDNAAVCGDTNLAIYGQGGETEGKFSATGSPKGLDVSGQSVSAITINGGQVTAIGDTGGCGINASSVVGLVTITINGGQVEANGGIYAGSSQGTASVTINGGQVTATGGTNGYGINVVSPNNTASITLGWKNTTDFIKASSYSGTVKTADGKPFIAYTPAATANDSEKQAVLIQGNTTLTANAIAAIAGKVLRPATADDVTVSYMDWDDSQKKLVSKNTATDNNADNDIVYVLQGGGATDLPGGWYVAKGEVSYTGQLSFTGDAHLILADNAAMKVTPSSDDAIYGSILTIYSQSIDDDMGSLSANSSHNYCQALNVYDNLTINGGKVTVASKNSNNAHGIYNQNVITVNGGVVTATGNGPYCDQGIFTGSITINGGQVIATSKSDYGIRAYQDVIINGGQVTAIGTSEGHGIEAENITLGWTDTTDFIKASSYKVDNGHAVTADGKRFIAYNMASEGDISANCIIGSTTSETTLNDTDLGNIAGKTLRPLDGYYVEDLEDLTFSGKTAPDFTITTDAGTEDEKTTPYYIYKANDEVTLTTDKNYGQNGIWFITFPFDVIAEATGAPGTVVTTKTFAMPAKDFTINDVDYYNTGVKYMDWDDTEKKLVEKTTPDGTKVRILTGTTGPNTSLGGDWFVVNDCNTTPDTDGHSIDVAYNHNLDFNSSVNLILTDGCEMTVTVTGNSSAILVSGNLAIYGQNAGTGSLTATGGSSDGITANGNVTINGGNITATGNHGISANSTVTINGGKVTATGGTNGYGIYASSIFGNATIILNLTNGSDFIKASSYIAKVFDNSTASVKIPAGKALAYTYNNVTSGFGSTNDADYVFDAEGLAQIANKTLRPMKHMPVTGGVQYVAIYQEDGDWKVGESDVKIYVPTGRIIKNGNAYEMELQEVIGDGIPDGLPVILGNEGGLPDITFMGTSAAEANAIEANYQAAHPSPTFFAADGTKTLTELINDALGAGVDANDYVAFTLVGGKLVAAANSGNAVKAGTCTFVISKFDLLQMIRGTYTAPNSNAPSIVIDLGDVTGISDIKHESLNIKSDDAWYSLDGRRIANGQQPTAKGIYIYKGIKRVVK